MLRFLLFLSLLSPSLAYGQADQFASRIEVPAGKLVVLSSGEADSVVWRLVNPPADDNHQVFEGKLIFATGIAGEYWFVESAASVADDKITQKVLLHLVRVGNPPAPAPPGPSPQPTPKPLPEGRFGLAEATRQAVLRASGIDRKLCGAISGNWAAAAAQIAAGSTTSFTDANTKLKAKNRETTGAVAGKPDPWQPVFVEIGTKLNALATSKKLDTNDLAAVQAAFEEVRDGFAATIP